MQIPCDALDLAKAGWLCPVPDELLATRWLHFLLYEGETCSIKQQQDAYLARPRDAHRDDEVQWHAPLHAVIKVRACCDTGVSARATQIKPFFSLTQLKAGNAVQKICSR